MADIDPELQKRLDGIVLRFGEACNRIRDAATNAALAAQDLAFELDAEARQRASEIASLAIEAARK